MSNNKRYLNNLEQDNNFSKIIFIFKNFVNKLGKPFISHYILNHSLESLIIYKNRTVGQK